MKRLIAGIVVGIALGFIIGHFTARPAEADHFSFSASHWGRVEGQEARIGIKTVLLPNDELQSLANAAAGWSLHPLIEIGIIGEGDPLLCGEDGGSTMTLDVGYVLVCHYPHDYGEGIAPQAWTACDVEYPFEGHKNQCEFGLWHEIVHHPDGSLRMQAPCHELAHVLGFRDYTWEEKDSGLGGGCLGGANTTAEFECPSAKDFAHLSDLYAHADSHTTAGPAGAWTVEGVTDCAQFVAVTPTPTRSATPTQTATANPTPTTFPGPSCWPPKAKRCR